MELTFLGTSSGTPTKQRNVSGVAISESKGRKWYLVDCGEGTQHQILHTKLSLNTLSAIFITHVHGDHCYGLPGLIASTGMTGRCDPLKIIAPKGIKQWVESTCANTALALPFEIEFIATESMNALHINRFVVNCVLLAHRVPSYAYSFSEVKTEPALNKTKLEALAVPKGPLWGRLQAGEDVLCNGTLIKAEDVAQLGNKVQKIIIGGDNSNPSLLKDLALGCDVLVHESTYAQDMAERAIEYGHSYSTQIASFANEACIPNLVLTHFSSRYQVNNQKSTGSLETIRAEALSCYSGRLYLAEDLERYHLDKKGQLSLLKDS